VHPLAPNDHVHTRLTHSIEVARVGNALGKELGLRLAERLAPYSPNDLGTIVQGACLAHDLGNPPFGHTGEEAMKDWFELKGPNLFKNLTPDHRHDLISFEGNAQGFRIVAQTENHLFRGGLQLTYATLGAFQKYPWSSRVGERKFGSFISEESILEKVADELGLRNKAASRWSRHPLAHLVDATDDICYAIIDLEDAVELGIVPYEQVETFLLGPFDGNERVKIKKTLAKGDSHRINLARLRGPVFAFAISGAIEGYMKGYDRIIDGNYDGNVFDLLKPSDARKKLVFGAKEFGRKHVFHDIKKIEIEIGCYATFDHLLGEFCTAALNQELSPNLGDGRGQAAAV